MAEAVVPLGVLADFFPDTHGGGGISCHLWSQGGVMGGSGGGQRGGEGGWGEDLLFLLLGRGGGGIINLNFWAPSMLSLSGLDVILIVVAL